ncbi:hypothetical protein [Subtercola vilae]|uniref:Uncharacterized protein n=1 Tax=Subtercola vilae TaxID=2056433 RepID=A0A4V4REM4_9MICO|nr:hypothetical protein [Subtercola vilae]TIH34604.1 hypothetical protein D4765_12330 [Subtercola vilae]
MTRTIQAARMAQAARIAAIAAITACAAGVTALGVSSAAFATPAPVAARASQVVTVAPAAGSASVLNFVVPLSGNPAAHDLLVTGALSGLRASDAVGGFGAFITCDDLNTYTTILSRDTVTKYPDGSGGAVFLFDLPALEQGHSCRLQATAPAHRTLVFSTRGWISLQGELSMSLAGRVGSSSTTGGL